MKNINNNNVKGRAYYQSLRAKYLNLAKEASTSGDRILSEYNLQFAEHYGRILAEKFSQPNPQSQQQNQISQTQQQQGQTSQTQQEAQPENPEQDQGHAEEQVKEKPQIRKKRVVRKNPQPQEEKVAES